MSKIEEGKHNKESANQANNRQCALKIIRGIQKQTIKNRPVTETTPREQVLFTMALTKKTVN